MRFRKIIFILLEALLVSVSPNALMAGEFQITGQQSVDSDPFTMNTVQKKFEWLSTSSSGILVSLRGQPTLTSKGWSGQPTPDWVNIFPDRVSLTSSINILHPSWQQEIYIDYGFAADGGGFWGVGNSLGDRNGRKTVMYDYLLKLDVTGKTVLVKQLSNDWHNISCSIETEDGLILAGWKDFVREDKAAKNGRDYAAVPWVEKTDKQGKILWQVSYSEDKDGFIDDAMKMGNHCKRLVALNDGSVIFATSIFPTDTKVPPKIQAGRRARSHICSLVLKIDSSGKVIAQMKSEGHTSDDAYIFALPDGGFNLVEHYVPSMPDLQSLSGFGRIAAVATAQAEGGGIRITKLDNSLNVTKTDEFHSTAVGSMIGDVLLTRAGKFILVGCDNSGILSIGYLDPDTKASLGARLPPSPLKGWNSCGTNGLMETANDGLLLFSGDQTIGYRLFTLKTNLLQ